MAYESEVAELLEGIDSEGIGEWGEASRGRRLPKTASGRNLAPTQPSKSLVTMSMLQSALQKVGGQIKMNTDAINSVASKANSTTAALKKEFEERKKEMETSRKDTNQKVSMLALLPLLIQSPTYTIKKGTLDGGTTPTADFNIAPPPTSMLNALLPVMLVGGLGGSGPGGSDGGGMDTTMMLVLALALTNQPQTT